MSEDYFDAVWIGLEKAILFWTDANGADHDRELTAEERDRLEKLEAKHFAQRVRLLREMAA
jgi:hypothetical protein